MQTTFSEVIRTASLELRQSSVVQRDTSLGLERIARWESSQEIESTTVKQRFKSPSRPPAQGTSTRGNGHVPDTFICQLSRRGHCFVDCACVCHQYNGFWSPNFLSLPLGLLFIGYNGNARIFEGCDTLDCRARSNKKLCMYYMFPQWMVNMVIFARVCSQGPELLLRCLRMREYEVTLAFQSVHHCRLDLVQSLIATGQTSILDVDQCGRSLLYVCLTHAPRFTR